MNEIERQQTGKLEETRERFSAGFLGRKITQIGSPVKERPGVSS